MSIKTECISNHNPVDTGHKLNVHKMFIRRPGHLLNVLCTFNLCPVSMGNDTNKHSNCPNYGVR